MPDGLRCIAGKELTGERPQRRGWIRLVASGREKPGLLPEECQYRDGKEPRVLDVMDVPVLRAEPNDYQRENWLIDTKHYWEKVHRVLKNELEQLIDPTSSLWIDGYRSLNGQNDRIPGHLADKVDSSLHLIKVDRLELCVSPDYNRRYNQRRVQGCFQHKGADYELWITDFPYQQQYLQKPDGRYRIGECFLTISLGKRWRGDAYKLIAAIIKP